MPKRRLFIMTLTLACGGLLMSGGLLGLAFTAPMDLHVCLRYAPSGEIFDHNGALLAAFLAPDHQWRFPRTLQQLGPRIAQATIAAEDQRFHRHHGVDPLAVLRAVRQNLREQRVVSGASTITMQVAKRAGASATPLQKAWQAIAAIRLERIVSKDEILAAYLNTAPYGLNLSGAEAAARRYFGKPANELTLPEAALLAALPKAPTTLAPLRHPEAARRRRDYVLARMRDEGFITPAQCDEARATPLAAAWRPFPQLAPHLARQYRLDSLRNAPVRLTLDRAIQETAERLVANALKRHGGQFGNIALMVADVPGGAILARVGSGGFYTVPGGQVDACRSPRSPGSALKPFTYALAIENNLLYSTEMLLDDTLDYGLYQANNFDGVYTGLVTAGYALTHSLNVPAVTVLNRVGLDPIHTFLRAAGLTTLTRDPIYYGLGLTLGSCEVRLEEMMAAYTMLAGLGQYRPLRDRQDQPPAPPLTLLARGTCLKLYEMLDRSLPEQFDDDLIKVAHTPRTCWKTGTSSGHRDAWAFVFNAGYVVGVWMGNNDNSPSEALVGIRTALPLAARMFRALPALNTPDWPAPNDDITPAVICTVSGLPASTWCKKTATVQLPRTQLRNRICDVHYPAPAGSPAPIAERWPGNARTWDLAHITHAAALGQSGPTRREALRIIEPSEGAEFVLTGETGGDRIRLRSSLDEQAAVAWYLDDHFLGKSQPGTPVFLDLEQGPHTLACMSDAGAVDNITFTAISPDSITRFDP